MVPELGHILLIITFSVAAMQCVYWLYNLKNATSDVILFLQKGSLINFLFIFLSFVILIFSFITSDFSLYLIILNVKTKLIEKKCEALLLKSNLEEIS